MTEDEIAEIRRLRARLDLMLIERWQQTAARLRGLIKSAESADTQYADGYRCCPWCGEFAINQRDVVTHADDCPAFTPDGQVR